MSRIVLGDRGEQFQEIRVHPKELAQPWWWLCPYHYGMQRKRPRGKCWPRWPRCTGQVKRCIERRPMLVVDGTRYFGLEAIEKFRAIIKPYRDWRELRSERLMEGNNEEMPELPKLTPAKYYCHTGSIWSTGPFRDPSLIFEITVKPGACGLLALSEVLPIKRGGSCR